MAFPLDGHVLVGLRQREGLRHLEISLTYITTIGPYIS